MIVLKIISIVYIILSLYILIFNLNKFINMLFEDSETDLYIIIDIVYAFLAMLYSSLLNPWLLSQVR